MSTPIPTDLKILDAIYRRYYGEFSKYSNGDGSRSSKMYVPIDIKQVAYDLKIDGDIVFGRLYFHLEHKYGYKQHDGTRVPFFALSLGHEVHCVNFPFMASVLADLQDQSRKHNVAIWIAAASLVVSAVSVVIAILL
jgi:hypothetical protein